jgi:hypothetical protein
VIVGMIASPMTRAALAFTVKSGWASAVLLAGAASSPRVVDSRRVELCDPASPESRQPYHAGFGTARASGSALSQLVAAVNAFGERSVAAAILQHRASSYNVCGIGVVAGSLIDPVTIGNDHIRIHALEGQLFRGIVEAAARKCNVSCTIWRQRDLMVAACGRLHLADSELSRRVVLLGRDVPGPWRAEQKAAAVAAWLVLAHKGIRR